MNDLKQKLEGLSTESLVFWRQVLNQPVQMPFWEAKSVPVQTLVKEGLISLDKKGEGTYATFTADLVKETLKYRFTSNERLFLTELAKEPLTITACVIWMETHDIPDPVVFLENLVDKSAIKYLYEPINLKLSLR